MGLKGALSVAEIQVRRREAGDSHIRDLKVSHLLSASDLGVAGISGLLRSVKGEVTLQAEALTDGEVNCRNLYAEVQVEEGVLRVDSLRAELCEGRVSVRAVVDGRQADGTLPATAEILAEEIQASGPIREVLEWPLSVYGKVELSMAVSGAVDSSLRPVKETLRAEGIVRMAEGKVVDWTWLQQVASGVAFLSDIDLEEIPVRSLEAPFRVTEEGVFFDSLRVRAADMDCRLNGSVGSEGRLDCTLDVDLPISQLNTGGTGLGGMLGAFFGGDSRVPVRVLIGGTTERPQVRVQMLPAK